MITQTEAFLGFVADRLHMRVTGGGPPPNRIVSFRFVMRTFLNGDHTVPEIRFKNMASEKLGPQ